MQIVNLTQLDRSWEINITTGRTHKVASFTIHSVLLLYRCKGLFTHALPYFLVEVLRYKNSFYKP